MSSSDNHKKVADITAACIGDKKLILKIYFKIMRDCPSAIVNAVESLRDEARGKAENYYKPWQQKLDNVYICKDCHEQVENIGIAGACITCDPAGFDVPHQSV